MDTFGWPISDIHEDNRLVSYIFVNGLPESRLFKITFPESRFVKSPNPVSRSKLQSRISLPFSSKIPNPGLQISQIPDPEKPIGDPLILRCVVLCVQTFFLIIELLVLLRLPVITLKMCQAFHIFRLFPRRIPIWFVYADPWVCVCVFTKCKESN